MFKPEDWEQVLDSGSGAGGKRAVALREGPDGEMEIVGIAEGPEAERMIAQALARGVGVKQDKEQVDELFRSGQAPSRVPPEVYELMSVIVQFAQELNDQWGGPRGEAR
jgi:type III secretion system FlhB-like substrate exporter